MLQIQRSIGAADSGVHPQSSKSDALAEAAFSICYPDTIELFCRRRPSLDKLFAAQGGIGAVHHDEKRSWSDEGKGFLWGHIIRVHQPTVSSIHLLDRICETCEGVTRRLDISHDQNRFSKAWLRQRLLQKWRPSGTEMMLFENGLAWVDYRGRREPKRNAMLYSDRESKINRTPECPHVDFRFVGTDTIRRLGVNRPLDILTLNPRASIEYNFKLVEGYDAFLQGLMREAVSKDREFYKGRECHPVVDRYRANISRRIAGWYDRYGSLQGLVDDHMPLKLKDIDIDILDIPTVMTFLGDPHVRYTHTPIS